MHKKIGVVFLFFSCIWMILIFYLSSQNASQSSSASNVIVNIVIEDFLKEIYENKPLFEQEQMRQIISHVVRKIAHFSEFAILELFVFLGFYFLLKSKLIIYSLGVGIPIIYAVVDEFHQGFVDGRSPQLFDVLIDSLGAITMVLFITFIISIIEIVKFRRNNSKKNV